MSTKLILFSACLAVVFPMNAAAAEKDVPAAATTGRAHPPVIEGAQVETYKRVGDVDLRLWWFAPARDTNSARPAIVFFFGGGWRSGSPAQFVHQARHLADRGMVAMVADYRVESRHQAKPVHCFADAKSCLRWIRLNAGRLGIDPNRVAASGGSAGGTWRQPWGPCRGWMNRGRTRASARFPMPWFCSIRRWCWPRGAISSLRGLGHG